jgi:phosphoglycerate dehydrogenase-like enzyme
MAKHLAWVPAPQLSLVGEVPDDVEVAGIPEDPASDARLGDVDFLVVPFGGNLSYLFPKMSSLKVVHTVGAGVDSIVQDVPPELTLCCCRGANDAGVGEWTVSAILAGLRHFTFHRDEQVAGRWSRKAATQLADCTVLFVGYGSIAQHTERLLTAFGPQILRVAKHARPGVEDLTALPELLGEADVVVMLLPLTPQTTKMVDATFLARMKDGALLVNASRGRIVDTDDLIEALQAGHITAVLDVTDPEPLPSGHPLFFAPGVFITPHTAGVTKNGPRASYRIITEQLRRFANGEELVNVVKDGY